MTKGETIELKPLGERSGYLPNWDSLQGYVGLHFEDIEVSEGEKKLEFKEGKKSPYILKVPIWYGESIYEIYFNSRKALYNAVNLLKKKHSVQRVDDDEDEQEDINRMSEEEFGEWKAKQEKAFAEGKLGRSDEQDAQRRAWIEKNGSEQLKQIVSAGDDYELLYLIEKGAHLLGKEYVIDYKEKVEHQLRQNPSPEAEEEEERLNQNKELNPDYPLRAARAVWIPKDRLEAMQATIEGVNFYKKIKTIKPNYAKSIDTKRTKMMLLTKVMLLMKDGAPHSWDEIATVLGKDNANPILHILYDRKWISEGRVLDLKNKEVLNFLGISDGDVKCNDCHSKNIVQWGKKQRAIGLRQVWKCKDCGHKFVTSVESAEKNNLSNKSVWNTETPIKWKCELCGNNGEWKLDMDDGKITYLCTSDYDKILKMAGDGGIEDVVAVTKLKSEIREKIETPKEQEIIETPIKWKCVVPDCKKDGVWELGATSEDAEKFWRGYMGFSLCAEHFEEFNHDDSDMERFQAFSRLKKRRL